MEQLHFLLRIHMLKSLSVFPTRALKSRTHSVPGFKPSTLVILEFAELIVILPLVVIPQIKLYFIWINSCNS